MNHNYTTMFESLEPDSMSRTIQVICSRPKRITSKQCKPEITNQCLVCHSVTSQFRSSVSSVSLPDQR